MAQTCLQLVRQALGELGLAQPSAIIGNSDPQIVQFLNLLNKVGQDLVTDYEWQRLNKEYRFNTTVVSLTGTTTSGSAVVTGLSSTASLAASTFMVTGTGIPSDCYISTVDSGTQVTLDQNATASGSVTLTFTKTKYTLPSDWDRPVNRTEWDKTNHWELIGPKTGQEWQYLKGGIVATGPRMRYRILGNTFQIWPPATTESRVGLEYISNQWVVDTLGTTYRTSFTVDTDTCLFRDRLMITGVKYEFMLQKGFDVTGLAADYTAEIDKEKGGDKGSPTLSMGGSKAQMFISPGSIPDSGYGNQ